MDYKAEYKEDATPTSWKEKVGESQRELAQVRVLKGGGKEQMCEVSRSDVG